MHKRAGWDGGGHRDFAAQLVVCLDCALVLELDCSKFLLLMLLPKSFPSASDRISESLGIAV
jgi:hypothetical protein